MDTKTRESAVSGTLKLPGQPGYVPDDTTISPAGFNPQLTVEQQGLFSELHAALDLARNACLALARTKFQIEGAPAFLDAAVMGERCRGWTEKVGAWTSWPAIDARIGTV